MTKAKDPKPKNGFAGSASPAYWPSRQYQPHHRRFPDLRRVVGRAEAVDPQARQHPSVWRWATQGSRPHLRQRHLLRAAHRLPVESLDATGICSGSTAHLRFQEWVAAGVFLELWRVGVERYDELQGLDWSWLSLDGAMTKAPLGGEKNRPQSHRPGQRRGQAQPVDRGPGHSGGLGGGGSQPP